jgi:hypothetical protein
MLQSYHYYLLLVRKLLKLSMNGFVSRGLLRIFLRILQNPPVGPPSVTGLNHVAWPEKMFKFKAASPFSAACPAAFKLSFTFGSGTAPVADNNTTSVVYSRRSLHTMSKKRSKSKKLRRERNRNRQHS